MVTICLFLERADLLRLWYRVYGFMRLWFVGLCVVGHGSGLCAVTICLVLEHADLLRLWYRVYGFTGSGFMDLRFRGFGFRGFGFVCPWFRVVCGNYLPRPGARGPVIRVVV